MKTTKNEVRKGKQLLSLYPDKINLVIRALEKYGCETDEELRLVMWVIDDIRRGLQNGDRAIEVW